VEELSVLCADGRLKARFIPVESEHSAMACCIGASAAGCAHLYRHFLPGSGPDARKCSTGPRERGCHCHGQREPGPGVSFQHLGEQSDSLAQRDTGWLQIYCESNQEVLDTVIQSFKIAEQVFSR